MPAFQKIACFVIFWKSQLTVQGKNSVLLCKTRAMPMNTFPIKVSNFLKLFFLKNALQKQAQ